MRAHLRCVALAALTVAGCSSPDADLFVHGSPRQAETPTSGGGASFAGSNNGGGNDTTHTTGGSTTSSGGSTDRGTAGDPGIQNQNSAGSTSSAGDTSSVSSAGSAGDTSSAGSTSNAGSTSSAGDTSSAGSTSNAGSAGNTTSDGGNGGSGGLPSTPVCGNGIIEDGEQCDAAGHVGAGCDAGCRVVCSQHGPGALESDDHHCYVGYNQAAFAGAQQDCVRRGAHLATISSAAENKLARALVSNSKWLGGDEDVPATSPGTGNYAWLTGEAFTFTAWGPQEPNRAASRCAGTTALCYEHCIVMLGDGTWADHRCDIVDGYICEWEPAGK